MTDNPANTKTMIGQKLGSFLIEEQIGAGAMGIVYRAIHEKTGKTVALKVIIAEGSAKSNLPERFDREAKILQNFSHPHIVRWLGHGRYKGTGYFAMEYLTGRDPGRPHHPQRAHALAADGRTRHPDQRRAELRPREERRPPRPETLEPAVLRPTARSSSPTSASPRTSTPRPRLHGHRPDPGDLRLHGPRTNPRHSVGQP